MIILWLFYDYKANNEQRTLFLNSADDSDSNIKDENRLYESKFNDSIFFSR